MEKKMVGNINPKRMEVDLKRDSPIRMVVFIVFLISLSFITSGGIAMNFRLIFILFFLFELFEKKPQKLIITHKYVYYLYSYSFGVCVGIKKFNIEELQWEYMSAPNMSTAKKIKMLMFYRIKKRKRKKIFSLTEINFKKEDLEQIIAVITS